MKDIARLTRLRNLDFDRLRLIEEYDKLTTYDELESEVNSDYLCLKTYNNEETCQCFNFVSKFDWFLKSKNCENIQEIPGLWEDDVYGISFFNEMKRLYNKFH